MTIQRWEKRGILRRCRTRRPGAWYREQDLDALIASTVVAPNIDLRQGQTPQE
jgi:hypothetical protein